MDATGPEPGPAADPQDSDAVLALITETGRSLNRSLFPVSNTTRVLGEIAEAYGAEVEFAVFPNVVIGVEQRTRTIEMHRSGAPFRFDQIAATQNEIQLARTASIRADAATQALRDVEARRPIHPVWVRLAGYIAMAVGIAACFRMSPEAMLGALVLGAAVGGILLAFGDRAPLRNLMPVALTFGCALLTAAVASVTHVDDPVRLAVVPLVVLIPAAPLTSSLIELTSGDMEAGASRLIYAMMILLSMAFGFAAAVYLAGLPTTDLDTIAARQPPAWAPWVGAVLFATGCILYFCTPRQLALWATVVPLATFALSHLMELVFPTQLATGVAVAFALCLSWLANGGFGVGPSVIVLFLPAFWLLVPGSMVFVALSGILTGDEALTSLGREAGLTILSMVIGIMVAGLAAPLLRRSPRPA